MPRKNLIRSSDLPYHVTARANNREAFFCDLNHCWRVISDRCFELTLVWEARIHALVLMPNHFHLLISTPKHDLGKLMEHFMRSITKSLNRDSGRSGRVFGGPYYRTLIDSTRYFAHALKYVYRNPVRAKICVAVEDYPFSTLSGLLGTQRLPFPIHFPFGLDGYLGVPAETGELLTWLNRPFLSEHEQAIQKALKRTLFKSPKAGWKRNLLPLDQDLL